MCDHLTEPRGHCSPIQPGFQLHHLQEGSWDGLGGGQEWNDRRRDIKEESAHCLWHGSPTTEKVESDGGHTEREVGSGVNNKLSHINS